MQGLYGAPAKPIFGDNACPHCNTTISDSYMSGTPVHKNISLTTIWTLLRGGWKTDFNNLFELVEAITSMKF